MLIPLIEGRLDGVGVVQGASAWGSILPAVWSFMLAARERGLGSAWTTLHLTGEREVADLLGIPFDRYTQAGLFPVAYTVGTDFKPAARLPAADVVHFDTW
jgi:nitroreductase